MSDNRAANANDAPTGELTIEAELPTFEAVADPDADAREFDFGTQMVAEGSGTALPPLQTQSKQRIIGGKYVVLERIAQGGMGRVYRVRHQHLENEFALKIMMEQVAGTPGARDMFFREAKIASSFSHLNIAHVVDFGDDPDMGMYMVMELVDGEPLHRMLHREKRLSIRFACDIVMQVADALHHIHQRDIVHCDIKTENILITEVTTQRRRQRVAKLLDFGLARRLSGKADGPLSGTPQYIAPERIRGEQPTPASDVYSLGILLYELITGRVPWEGSVEEILRGHLERPPAAPSTLVAGVDPALDRLILHALAKKPSDRHRDCAQFQYELKTAMDMMGLRARQPRVSRGAVEVSPVDQLELASRGFRRCRLPLAMVDQRGTVAAANDAFAIFVLGRVEAMVGLALSSTALPAFWPSFAEDLATMFGDATLAQVERVLVVADEHGQKQILVWMERVDDATMQIGAHQLGVTLPAPALPPSGRSIH